MEQWVSLSDLGYPNYEVSDYGRVRNRDSGRILKESISSSGAVKVGLYHHGANKQNTFGVAPMVARAFVPRMENCHHVIHLDGDRTNNTSVNLAWRPWWFAKQYHRQFNYRDKPAVMVPIRDVVSGETFENSWEACKEYGLLDNYVLLSVSNGHPVYPTGQCFVLVND